MLIDTHAHLSFPDLVSDRDEVIQHSVDAEVMRIIDVGTNAMTSQSAVETAGDHDEVFASVGFHPHDAMDADEPGLATIRSFLERDRVVAVGETGLDFYRDYAPHDLQERLLRSHIQMALDTHLPLILHSRGAEDRVIEIMIETGAAQVGGVLHCFGGSADQAARAVEAGFYLGFGGTVTFKNSNSLKIALSVPGDRRLLETDCPYLAPVPFRGKRNEPAYVRHIAEFLAEAEGISLVSLSEQTTENAVRLFSLEG